jgi:PAS domain S-box-containing protein
VNERATSDLPNISATASAPAALLRPPIAAAPVGIFLIDRQGRISHVNDVLCSALGYAGDELLGKSPGVLFPAMMESDGPLQRAGQGQPLAKPIIAQATQARLKCGLEIEVVVSLHPLVAVESASTACTVRRLADLQEPENSLKGFFNLSSDLFCIASPDAYFLRVNPSFTAALGYSERELLSRPFLDFVHPDDIAATRREMQVLAAGEPVNRFRNRYRTRDGEFRWIEWSARAAREDEIIYGVGRDVTDAVQLTREIQVKDQRERAILDSMPAVVYLKDVQGRYQFVNQRFTELLALDSDAVIDKTDYDLFPKEIADRFTRNDRKVIEKGDRLSFQETAPHPDGPRTYSSVKFPLRDLHGEVAAVAGISTDISEQLKAQAIRDELQLATVFQQRLFPVEAPSIPGVDISGSAVPVAELCGDYFDFISTGPERITIAVGDVSGHGVGPALAMVEVRSFLRGILHYGSNIKLSNVIKRLNRLLLTDLPEGSFASLFLAQIDIGRRQLRYAGAGHRAFIFHANGEVTTLDSTGPVVGLLPAASPKDVPPMTLGDDDLLFVCTDGVTEAMNVRKELFGHRRMADCIVEHRRRTSREIIQQLFTRVVNFAADNMIVDDMTAVVVKFRPRP